MTLVLAHVAKSFRKRGVSVPVLSNVSAVFEPGQSLCILGAPKSGKSTLMRILAGEIRPDSGWVHREGRVSYLVGSSIGRMGSVTVREAIAFMARLYGFRTREIVDFTVDFAELGPVLMQQVEKLSKDESARLAYTLSYALPFDIYLADESLVSGPPSFQDRCAALIAERRKTSGLVITTAKVRKARDFADRGGVLHNGELSLFPTLDEAIEAYEALNPLYEAYETLPEEPVEDEDSPAEAELF
ncbi:MAG TPA: ATP-binding cassette domain-containing protein [Microvirga sp.]|nr:ATP-binding cassette domain-containing protein [Microvirga sp.]